jgi:hypothetical protein
MGEMAKMELEKILSELSWVHPCEPCAAVEEAMTRQEEIVPELLILLEEFSEEMENFYSN